MHDSVLSTVALPVALAIIMLGLGLSLALADFRRVLNNPRAVIVALGCQMIVMPLVCIGLIAVFRPDPYIAVGMMLLAASPGGTLAAVYSHLAHGEIALNITLTAVNSVLSVVTLPLVVWWSTQHYLGNGGFLGLQIGGVVTVVGIVLVPLAIGMVIRHVRREFAERLHAAVKVLSLVILVAVVVGSLVQNRDALKNSFAADLPLVASFSILGLAIGYAAPRLLDLPRPQAVSNAMEVGVHNSALAITIATSPALLNDERLSLAPAYYALVSFITAAVAAWLSNRMFARRVTPVTPAASRPSYR